jgi:hypothetical protein
MAIRSSQCLALHKKCNCPKKIRNQRKQAGRNQTNFAKAKYPVVP